MHYSDIFSCVNSFSSSKYFPLDNVGFNKTLNFENDFNEFIFNARLANIVIKLAVKTGRPQYFKVTKVLQIYDN